MTDKKSTSWDILWLADSLTHSTLGKIFIWLALLLLANQTFGDPVWKFTDSYFGIEEQKVENTYNLQVKTLEFLEKDVMSKLDDIYIRMDNVEEDTKKNEKDIEDIEKRLENIEKWH